MRGDSVSFSKPHRVPHVIYKGAHIVQFSSKRSTSTCTALESFDFPTSNTDISAFTPQEYETFPFVFS